MPESASKTCTKCGETKPPEEFHRRADAADGHAHRCKACVLARQRQYAEANRQQILESQLRYREAHREEARERARLWHAANRKRALERLRQYGEAIRAQAFGHYGWSCACCGSTVLLTIDHVNGGGSAHRKELFGSDAGSKRFYRWLIDNGFPEGFQTLCGPCNTSKKDCDHCRLDHVRRGSGLGWPEGQWIPAQVDGPKTSL